MKTDTGKNYSPKDIKSMFVPLHNNNYIHGFTYLRLMTICKFEHILFLQAKRIGMYLSLIGFCKDSLWFWASFCIATCFFLIFTSVCQIYLTAPL